MIKTGTTLLFVFMLAAGQAQTGDSTDIKLHLYKDLHAQNQANSQQYRRPGRLGQHYNTPPDTGAKQYNKKITFEIRVEPVTFFSVRYVLNYHGTDLSGNAYSNSSRQNNMIYPGMAIAAGVAIKK